MFLDNLKKITNLIITNKDLVGIDATESKTGNNGILSENSVNLFSL